MEQPDPSLSSKSATNVIWCSLGSSQGRLSLRNPSRPNHPYVFIQHRVTSVSHPSPSWSLSPQMAAFRKPPEAMVWTQQAPWWHKQLLAAGLLGSCLHKERRYKPFAQAVLLCDWSSRMRAPSGHHPKATLRRSVLLTIGSKHLGDSSRILMGLSTLHEQSKTHCRRAPSEQAAETHSDPQSSEFLVVIL